MSNEPIYNPFDEDEKAFRQPTFWAILGIGTLCLCTLAFVMLYLYKPNPQEFLNQYFPSPTATYTHTPPSTPTKTLTPTRTPTPTITTTPHPFLDPAEGVTVFNETFESNTWDWDAAYRNNSSNVENGKLMIKSNELGYVGMALCYGCKAFINGFYYQAELLPEEETSVSYGISYCASLSSNDYYVFQVNTLLPTYSLFKYASDDWEVFINREPSNTINKYPGSNTLGVKYDQGKMDLYINGILVDSYMDENQPSCNKIGVFVDGSNLEIFADNIFVYDLENSTP